MEKNFSLPHVLTAQDVQVFLNISKSKAYDLFKVKGFPVITIGGNKRVYKDDLLVWIENHKNKI